MDGKNRLDSRPEIKLLTVLLLFLFPFFTSAGQKVSKDTPPLKERLFFGGNLGLQFGTITDIQVSPVVGLWVLPRLAVAAGPDYRFYKEPDYRTDIIGGSTYVQYHFIQDINNLIPAGIHLGFFVHAEDELLSLESSFWKDPPYTSKRFFVNNVLAGAGISQPLGMRSSFQMMFLWQLTQSDYSIYGNPEVRISFIF